MTIDTALEVIDTEYANTEATLLRSLTELIGEIELLRLRIARKDHPEVLGISTRAMQDKLGNSSESIGKLRALRLVQVQLLPDEN
jgi:hypothetical protein